MNVYSKAINIRDFFFVALNKLFPAYLNLQIVLLLYSSRLYLPEKF